MGNHLIHSGLYDTLAELFVSGEAHRKLSYALLAKKLGAEVTKEHRSIIGVASNAADLSFSSMRRSSRNTADLADAATTGAGQKV